MLMIKNLNLKIMILLEYPNIKTFNKSKKEKRVEKVIKRKGGKLFVTWKCYDSSFNI